MLQAQESIDQNAVVYTPCHIDDDGLHLYNVTLPQGMICTDVLPGLGKGLHMVQEGPACDACMHAVQEGPACECLRSCMNGVMCMPVCFV